MNEIIQEKEGSDGMYTEPYVQQGGQSFVANSNFLFLVLKILSICQQLQHSKLSQKFRFTKQPSFNNSVDCSFGLGLAGWLFQSVRPTQAAVISTSFSVVSRQNKYDAAFSDTLDWISSHASDTVEKRVFSQTST